MAITVSLALLAFAPAAAGQQATAERAADAPVASDVATGLLDELWTSAEITTPPNAPAAPSSNAPQATSAAGEADGPQPILRRSSPGQTARAPDGPPRRDGSWIRTAGALAAVVGLIVLLGWGYRAVSTGNQGLRGGLLGRNNGLIEVVGRTNIAPRQTLYLVRVGPRLVLLGMSSDNVRALDVIDDPNLTAELMGAAARQRADSQSTSFNRLLEAQSRGYQEDASLDETITPDETRIGQVRHQLAGVVERLRTRAVGA